MLGPNAAVTGLARGARLIVFKLLKAGYHLNRGAFRPRVQLGEPISYG